MRVLHILEATGGGAARHVIDLCEGLARRGLEVHLAYSPLRMDRIMREGLPRLQAAGVQLLEVPMRRAPHPSDLRAIAAIFRHLREAGPFRLLHGHSSKGGGIARLLGLADSGGHRVIYTPHAFITLNPKLLWIEELVYGSIERLLAFRTDALIVGSILEAREALRLGYPKSKVHLIYNGISLDPVSPKGREEVRGRLGLKPQDLVVGFVGRFSQQKAPQLLLEAFAKVAPSFPEARLVMVGDGPLKGALVERARALGLEGAVLWPGFMDGRTAMRAFDIFVLPSLYEGFPYAVLEAMAEGLPVIATAVGGVRDAVANEENGFIVPVGSVEGLAEALSRLMKDESLRLAFGRRSLERVRRFSVEEMVSATLQVYQNLLRYE